MNGFRDFIDDLLHTDSIGQTVLEHKKEAVKLAAVMTAVLLAVLLFMHQQDADLLISEDGQGTAVQTRNAELQVGTEDATDSREEEQVQTSPLLDTDGIVYVDIGGAVKHPMLAELTAGSRVEDAIRAAGGLKKDADLSEVNRAQILTDGEKVYIPSEGEESPAAASAEASSSGAAAVGISRGRVNINTADVTLLQQLTGVGPVTAQKIIDYREQNGKFKAVEDLKKVSGIGDKTFEKMRDDVTI